MVSCVHKFSGTKERLTIPEKIELLCCGKIIKITTDNTTVFASKNKEDNKRSDTLCTLAVRYLSWGNLRQIILKARRIPGHLNVIANSPITARSSRQSGFFSGCLTGFIRSAIVLRYTCSVDALSLYGRIWICMSHL